MSLSPKDRRKLALFREAFKGRQDVYGKPNPYRKCDSLCEKSPLTDRIVLDHLRGKQLVGVYPLVVSRVWFAAIDLDQPDPETVMELVRLAHDIELDPLVEKSKSKGYHLWFFADKEGWPAVLIRAVLRWITAEAGRPEVEVFPKQDRLGSGSCRYGNFIYMPLNGKLVRKARTIFVEPARWMPPVESQWGALAGRARYSAAHISKVVDNLGLPDPTPHGEARVDGSGQGGISTGHRRPDIALTQFPLASFGLPPCTQRMLAGGVTEYQRVACFRLAVQLHRVGVPEDLARVMLAAWSKKNRPTRDKHIITPKEIAEQTRCGYSGRYRGYGCEDSAVAPFCDSRCPVLAKAQHQNTKSSTTHRTVRPLPG